MNKIRYSLGACAIILVACGQSPEANLNATCNSVMMDPQVRSDIVRAGLNVETYCDCVTSVLLALPENEKTTAIQSFELIESQMANHDGDAEAAFEAIRNASRADDATPEAIAAYRNLDALGDQLDDILDGIEAAGGNCPA